MLHHVDSMELPMLKLLINAGAKIFPNKVSLSCLENDQVL